MGVGQDKSRTEKGAVMDSKLMDLYARAKAGEPAPFNSPSTARMMEQRPRAVARSQEMGDSADDVTVIENLARRAGVDPERANAAEVMAGAWRASPTDGVGEAIDRLSQRLGVPPPWANKR